MSKNTFLLGGVSLALLAAPAWAQQERDAIENIYISATRAEGPQLPVATSLTVIDREQIRLSGALQLTEVLSTQAGIQLNDADGTGGRNVGISMRGFENTSNNVLVLVDGRKLNSPTLAGPALNTVSVKDIERIEIVQGSAGVLYGDQAVGGVINVITRRAKPGQDFASVDAIRGSHGLEAYRASFSEGFNNGFSYRLSAQKHMADNYRDNNRQNLENLLLNIGYEVEEGRLYFERQRIDDELQLAGSLSEAQVADNRRQASSPGEYSNLKTDIKRYGGVWKINPAWSLLMDYADREERVEGFLWGNPYEQMTSVENFSPRLVGQFATAAGPAILTVGYDGASAEYATSFATAEQKARDYYGQLIYPLSPAVTLSLGQRTSEVEDTRAGESKEQRLNANEVGLRYQVARNWSFYTRRAEGFRYANVDENALVPADVDFLKPQETLTYEVGMNWRTASQQLQLGLYRMNVEGEITFDPSVIVPGSQFQGANVNLPDSSRRGLQAEYSIRLGEEWVINSNYTYTDSELTVDAYKGNDTPYVPAHAGNLSLGYLPSRNFSVYLDAQYTGSRYRLDDHENAGGKLSGMTLMNLNAIWVDDQWELGVRVRNLTDKTYSVGERYAPWGNSEYPQPGRAYEVRLSYHF